MRTTESVARMRRLLSAAVLLALGVPCAALADEEKVPAKPFDAKKAHSTICGYCHGDYGRAPGHGPQLMNSERSDEYMFNIIKNGKPGKMAAFTSAFTDDQIRQMVKFYRSLKPNEEPRNP
jgi:mono/diheme cytochrome c family protein